MAEQADNSLALTTLGIVAVFAAALFAIIVGFGIFARPAHARDGDLVTTDCQTLLQDEFFKPLDCLRVFMADDPLGAAEGRVSADPYRNICLWG